MKKIILLLLFPFSFIAQTLTVQAPMRFLALGDSYTIGQSVPLNQRWPLQLKDSLATRGILTDTMRIIATTGWRTDNLINAITNQQLQQQHYNLVSLLIGVNNQYQGVPISQYITEFHQLLDSAIRYAGGDTNHVFIVSIPDYAYTPYGQSTGNQTQISQEIDNYNLINKHIADSLNVRYFDITPISRQGIMKSNLVAADGLHPSGIQYGEWVKLMLQYIDGNIVTSLKENKSELLSVYPNPTNDLLQVSCTDANNSSIEIYNITGKLIFRKDIDSVTTEVSLVNLSEGIYFVRLVSGNKQVTQKFVKN
jgi:lysophospholipase L1-like esterase